MQIWDKRKNITFGDTFFLRRCAPKNMNLSVERIEEMVTRKTVPNGRPKSAKKAAEAAKSNGVSRGVSKKNESRDGAPVGVTQGGSLTFDRALDALEESPEILPNTLPPHKARVEMLFRLSNLKLVPGRGDANEL